MKDTRKTKSAVYLIDDDMIRTTNHPVPSGWDYDCRGAIEPAVHRFGRGFNISTDKEHNGPVSLRRRFLPLDEGKAHFACETHRCVCHWLQDTFLCPFFLPTVAFPI